MKYFYFFLFLNINVAHASNLECAMSAMQYFPEQKAISLNPIFIIEGYAYSQEHIEDFREREVYLESAAGEKVVLELKDILKGRMNLTQAIFKPLTRLSPNTRYYLKISAPTREDQLKEFTDYFNREKDKYETVYWETSEIENTELLNPTMDIVFKDTQVKFYGCGPAAYAVFKVSGNKEQVWYRTEMEDLKTQKKTKFYIREWEGKLNVGHGMCSGGFTFSEEGKYRVRFTPMNIDGKELKTTPWTTFNSPFLNGEDPWGF